MGIWDEPLPLTSPCCSTCGAALLTQWTLLHDHEVADSYVACQQLSGFNDYLDEGKPGVSGKGFLDPGNGKALRLVIPGIPGNPGNHIKSKIKFKILFIYMPKQILL